MNGISDIGNEALQLARALIKIPSLTPVTADLRPAAEESLDLVEGYLASSGALCHRLVFEGGHETWGYPVGNLYAEWNGDETLGHICFVGHTDVVAPGDAAAWSVNPYGGDVQDGFLLGRGATDMKAAVAAFCAAGAENATIATARPKVSALITTDEEWAAVNGTKKVLQWLKQTGREPKTFLIGEPSSPSRFGTHLKIGRRGSLCGTLEASGVQGHAAYPALYVNPNPSLTLALAVLSTLIWQDGQEGMPTTQFETIALSSGSFAATAIIPESAVALWNIRFTPKQTTEKLEEKLQNLLANPPNWAESHPYGKSLSRILLKAHHRSVSMPYYSPPAQFTHLVSSSVAKITGRLPVLDASGGTTDGRFILPVFPEAQIVELGLPENPSAYSPAVRGGMHQIDERCLIADLEALTQCYAAILSGYGQQP